MKPTKHRAIHELARGLYLVRVLWKDRRSGEKRDVKRQVQGTLAEALAAQHALRAECRGGGLDAQRATLKTYATSWLKSRATRLKPSTSLKYAADLDKHILPALGACYLDELRPSDVQEFVNEQAEVYAGWSVVNRLRLLRTIAKDALADGFCDRDFCARLIPPAVNSYDEEDPNLLTAPQLGALLATFRATEPALYPLFMTLATTGLRWSEVTALRWEDLDKDAGVLRIRRANWRGHVRTPKTRKSLRAVPLGPQLATALDAHRRSMVREQHAGLRAGWVFPNRAGGLHKGQPLQKAFGRALVAAFPVPLPLGSPANAKPTEATVKLTPHGLRRTFNNLARQVADREVVKAITGHVTDEMFAHYSLVDAKEKRAAQAAVLRMVSGKVESKVESGRRRKR